ncbi:MAG TPA: Hint domain-containing protein, partial [Acidisoma sp.]|nr:Hint domain-containing protein [Acidisoma sp.]
GALISVACFAAGTRIRTETGEVPVERLRLGELVVTHDGALRPIIWHGRRHVDCARHPMPTSIWPIRIARDAFGAGLPRRALWLSPDHAIFAEGVLIPVKHLVNGVTIRQESIDRITYVHIELPQHDVILAEGLPAESYLDTGDRRSFGGDVTGLHPAWSVERTEVSLVFEGLGRAPLRVAGPEVERARATLAARAEATGRGKRRSLRKAP